MCLISQWRFPKKAEKDIVVYKILEKDDNKYYRTPYSKFRVRRAEQMVLIPEESSLSFIYSHTKQEGYIHVFNIESDAITSLHFMGNSHNKAIFKGYIPKGTKFHLSKDYCTLCAKKVILTEKVYGI